MRRFADTLVDDNITFCRTCNFKISNLDWRVQLVQRVVVYVGGRLDGRKLLLVLGTEPIILLETEFKEGRWMAHAKLALGIAPNKYW